MFPSRPSARVIALMIIMCGGFVACCWLFADGFYLPVKPCRPLQYPSGHTYQRPEHLSHTLSPDSFPQVVAFYTQHLALQTDHWKPGVWQLRTETVRQRTYTCQSSDINGTTGETGCIALDHAADGVHIRLLLLRSEGSTRPCPELDTWEAASP
jgi:hypothetical protein